MFYAPLQWAKPQETEQWIEYKLGVGDWEGNHLIRAYRVRMDWRDWKPHQRNNLRYKMDIARSEAIKSKGAMKVWMFFVGSQDLADHSLLIVSRSQLICCLEGPKTI